MPKQTILVSSVGLTGHLNSVITIADYLVQHEYNILFVTSKRTVQYVKDKISGIEVFGIQDKLQEKYDEKQIQKAPFEQLSIYWKHQIIQEFIGKRKVSLIINDFGCLSILKFAKKLKIKMIINFPSPLELYSLLKYPNFKKAITFAGFTILFPQITPQIVLKKQAFLKYASEAIEENLVFFNSFFGFDEPVLLPPNIKMTGPLINTWNSTPIDRQLQQWLNNVRNQNLNIIYVTFGSVTHLTQQFFEKLYYDLKQTKMAVLWTIPHDDNILPQKNSKFFVRKWLPQISILKLPQVKLVLTHCGWNGVIQCIYHEKPMLCCPGFADQSINSERVFNAGIGLILRPQKHFLPKKPLNNPIWTTQQLLLKVEDLTTNKKYTNQLKKLKSLSEQTGGLQSVLKTVQNYLKNGNEHLIDKSVNKIHRTGVHDTILWIVILIVSCIAYQSLSG